MQVFNHDKETDFDFSNLDFDTLITWLSTRQYAPEGGFAGRTNKLVDGCYSHWAGGCWSLVEAALPQPRCLWDPVALERYILCCCQAKKGGLRDKPSTYVMEIFLPLTF